MTLENEKVLLLRRWYVRIRIAQSGHYKDAAKLKKRNTRLGILVVVFSTIVGTSIFASLSENLNKSGESDYLQILLGLISVAAATLAALQTFLNYSEESSKHLTAATKLSALKKEIEKNLILLSEKNDQLDQFVEKVKVEWNSITTESPMVSSKIFEEMFEKYGGESHFIEIPSSNLKHEPNKAN